MRESERIAEQIEILAKDLTPRGREIFEGVERIESSGAPAEEAAALLDGIDNDSDKDVIAGLLRLKAQMYSEMAEEESREVVNARLALQAIQRAAELEGIKVSDVARVGEAVEILKRHGEEPPAGLDLTRRYDIPPS